MAVIDESDDELGQQEDRSGDQAMHRELYFFALFRLLEGSMLVFMLLGPSVLGTVELAWPMLARGAAMVYLVVGLALLIVATQTRWSMTWQVAMGLLLDLCVAALILRTSSGADTAISMLLLVNVGAAALLLPWRPTAIFASLSAALPVAGYFLQQFGRTSTDSHAEHSLAEATMFSISYASVALLTHLLGRQMREQAQLVAQRGADLASLSQLNELIIRRMRIGVLVVDAAGGLQLNNEAAWNLLGQPSPSLRDLNTLSPALMERLQQWLQGSISATEPLDLGYDNTEVLPRFARLHQGDGLVLIFLDDAALVSRRAEALTVSSLGRLSASIAHEVRNPLAAISYAAQLLGESPDLHSTDKRLTEIILSHCQRMNGIIENVLSLSRREVSRPEQLELMQWVRQFVDEYKAAHMLDVAQLRAESGTGRLYAIVDPAQLHQAVTVLVQNALDYGRQPGQPPTVTLIARQAGEFGPPLIEVTDAGPGIPAAQHASIFEPFFTTHEHGTGLGLYIARQLCEANQASLEYVAGATSGACFRITLARSRALTQSGGMGS
jgi:two-component system sensor histidine kinase PilS (NtrC family)